MANEKIFHESWYRIADQKIVLRPSVRVRRQMFRGARWYIIHDPYTNQYYRLSADSYAFIARLSSKKTVGKVWEDMLEHAGETAPGQGEIIDILAQLYQANLLHYTLGDNSVKLFKRHQKKKQRIVKMTLMNIMFMRIPLFDPDPLLKKLMPIINITVSPFMAVIWVTMVLWGVKLALDNVNLLSMQSEGILSPQNLPLLYVGMIIVKIIHEFGHSFAVRRYGGEVHTMGVMLLLFTPMPYMDATASYFFRNKWKRVLVGSAGMLSELFVAAIAITIWANTGQGVIHSLAYNMIMIASVSTILFNINPLLRFDGYYILCDLINMPNLHQQANLQKVYVFEKYLFGCNDAVAPASSRGEAIFLSIFVVLSTLYRFVIFSGILMFIADKFLLIALFLGISIGISWTIVPLHKLIKYLFHSPSLARVRNRALTVSALIFLTIFASLALIPFPYNFKAHGVLKSLNYHTVSNPTSGKVIKTYVTSGEHVLKGDTLAILSNLKLLEEIKETRAKLKEAKLAFYRALNELQADMKPIKRKMNVFDQRLKKLNQDKTDLTVIADMDGLFISPEIHNFSGRWLMKGSFLGELINDEQFTFISIVSQQEVSQLFAKKINSVSVKIKGEAHNEITVKSYDPIPMEQTRLPSPALGFKGGGEIATNLSDSSGVATKEPFYEVRAQISSNTPVKLLHGRTGKMLFSLGTKPLLQQLWRRVRQLIQKRYRI